MNEWFTLPEQISLLKVRGSLAQVGNDTDPYKTSPYYGTSDFPGSAIVSSTLYNQDFKPEISTNYETGFDFRMFHNRIGLDFTFYYNRTKNQILDAPMDPTTGYSKATINSGCVRNRGYEIQLDVTPVVSRDFRWNATFTWSKNENRILSLAEGADENQLISSIGSVSIIGRVGGTTGDLWGYKLVRDPEGNVVITTTDCPNVRERLNTSARPIRNGKPDCTMNFLTRTSRLASCSTDKWEVKCTRTRTTKDGTGKTATYPERTSAGNGILYVERRPAHRCRRTFTTRRDVHDCSGNSEER